MENPDFFDPKADPKDFQAFRELAEERKGNPFLKLLGSLRGRVFNSSPKLKPTKKTFFPRGFTAGKPAPSKVAPKVTKTKDDVPPLEPIRPKAKVEPEGPKSQKATVEEVENEDTVTSAGKKKKKKKTKKKKAAAPENGVSPVPEAVSPPLSPVKPSFSPPPPVTPPKQSPKKQTPAPKSPSVRSPSFGTSSTTTLPHMSTTSLPFPLEQTTAQSAHSYVKDLEGPKTKVKSRSDHASIFSANSEKAQEKKNGFFSKFSRKDKPVDTQERKGDKSSWFSKLSKKTNKLAHQLLNTEENATRGLASMKWEHFTKLMAEMGFSIDPTSAGSSVRFDPPDPKDPPITFHRPHPDSTINPIMLKEFSKRLQRQYGWESEDLLKKSR